MKTVKIGQTVSGLELLEHRFGGEAARPKVLILGGVHGDEPEGVVLARTLLADFISNDSLKLEISLVCELNLDGVLKNQRLNLNGVDLNRNLPSKDWTAEVTNPRYQPGPEALSEPENQALVRHLEAFQPSFIISLHSWKPCLNTNGNCAPLVDRLHDLTDYPVVESIGYPTPGCLGTFTGIEQGIPTLTYEIEKNMNFSEVRKVHHRALIESLKTLEE